MPRDHSPSVTTDTNTKKKILFICGSMNQTIQMTRIAAPLAEYDCYFTPYYCDGFLEFLRKHGKLDFTVVGGSFFKRTWDYLARNNHRIDYRGELHKYDLVVRCADLVIQKNTKYTRSILVQEGMTDPRNLRYFIIRYLGILPRWASSTSAFGMSDQYDKFCVASEGYRDHFISSGAKPEKIVVTGIPNFDNCAKYLDNSFPYKGYVLVCTSDMRETKRLENRKRFIRYCVKIAQGKQVIFKLHPNEDHARAIAEIRQYAPGALVFSDGSAEEMVANCDVLITRYSSVVLVASALGKKVYSDLKPEVLKKLTPLQNQSAAENIADVCRELLEEKETLRLQKRESYEPEKHFSKPIIQLGRRKALRKAA